MAWARRWGQARALGSSVAFDEPRGEAAHNGFYPGEMGHETEGTQEGDSLPSIFPYPRFCAHSVGFLNVNFHRTNLIVPPVPYLIFLPHCELALHWVVSRRRPSGARRWRPTRCTQCSFPQGAVDDTTVGTADGKRTPNHHSDALLPSASESASVISACDGRVLLTFVCCVALRPLFAAAGVGRPLRRLLTRRISLKRDQRV